MSTVDQFKTLEGGRSDSLMDATTDYQKQMEIRRRMGKTNRSDDDLLSRIARRKMGFRPRRDDEPSLLQRGPEGLEAAMRKFALDKKLAKRINAKRAKTLARELNTSVNSKVIEKEWYTVTEILGSPVVVTPQQLARPFDTQPVIVHHPKDRWYEKYTPETLTVKDDDGTTHKYTKCTGETPKRVTGTQRFWVAVTQGEYHDLLDRAKNAQKIKNLNMMAIDGTHLKKIRAPMANGNGYVQLIRGDILKRFRQEKQAEAKLSEREKEMNSLKALNDRMERLLMKTMKKRIPLVKKAEKLTSGLDARTQDQLKKLTAAFNHPLKMASLFRPTAVKSSDGETKHFCDMLNTKTAEIEAVHGEVNTTASAYQQFGERERRTNKWHKALPVNDVCVSPEALGPSGKPYAQEVMPKLYHHLDEANALTKKINAKENTDADSETPEEQVWGDMVFCARPGDDEEACKADATYPLSNETIKRETRCNFTRMQREVPKSFLKKVPEKLEKGITVKAKIDLGKNGISNRYYDAKVMRVRKNGTLDLEFDTEKLSARQTKMIPGRCQPQFVDADDSTDASDLYHNKFYEEEQKYIKKNKKGQKKRRKLLDDEIQSIVDLMKKLEVEKEEEAAGKFDEMEDDDVRGKMPGYHNRL